jgi:predicted aconitase with swiveling domain
MFLLPLYYQQLHGETVLHAGLLLIPQGVGSLAARFVVAKLVAAATVPFAFVAPALALSAGRSGEAR